MRLVEQATLYTRIGGAVQLYQVDLCDTGADEFVVNYRWGKLNTVYRESSRTVFPVSLEEAHRIFQSLVQEKLAGGYVQSMEDLDEEAPPPPPADSSAETSPSVAPTLATATVASDDPRAKTVLEHLAAAAAGNAPKHWKLSRIIWRAGELGLADAAPHLLKIGLNGERFHDYSLLWSLARLRAQEAVPLLQSVFDEQKFPREDLQRVAAEGLMRCLPEVQRQAFASKLIKLLPAKLQSEIPSATGEQIAVRLAEVCQRHNGPCHFIYTVSLLSAVYPQMETALVHFCRQVALRPNYFQPIRWLFKAAELRRDASLFATLAYRFETTRNFYRSPEWGDYAFVDGAYIKSVKKEVRKPDSKLAYSDRTRKAFRLRSSRAIHRTGEAGNPDYIPLATEMLLQFDDEVDAGKPYETFVFVYNSGWRNATTLSTHYDTYSSYLAFNRILYANSPRYELSSDRLKWKCREGYMPGDPAPDQREEAFPQLWDEAPEAVIRLLAQSRCSRVHEFAVKVFRANMEAFAPKVKVADLIGWLARPSELTQDLALEICQAQYDPEKPSHELVLALLDCGLDRARATALDWVRAQPGRFLPDSMFTAALLTLRHEDVRTAAGQLLQPDSLDDSAWDIALARMVSILISLAGEEDLETRIESVRVTLEAVAQDAISRLPFAVIEDLLRQPDANYHALAAHLLKLKPDAPSAYPGGTLTLLIESPSPVARRVGTELFARFSDEELAERQDVVASLCLSQHSEIREAVRAVVARLAQSHPDFGGDLLERYYPLLLRKESTPGLHEDLLALILEHLAPFIDRIPGDYAMRMLRCPYLAGKELGWEVLKRHGGLDALTMPERVELGGNDVQRVRAAVREWFDAHPERVIDELAEAVRLVDSPWGDTQLFAMQWFREKVSEEQWTPEILVSLCDCNTPMVQAFGKELITRYFKTEDGPRYLLQLSQHPAASMQSFAVNYLEQHAADDVERLAELEHFFVSVLALIDQGRIAKTRVFAFLQREGAKSREAAEIVLRVLSRHSATISVTDKAACIEAMAELQSIHGELESPLTLVEPRTA